MSNRRRAGPLLWSSRTRTSPPPVPVTGSSGWCAAVSRCSLRIGRRLAARGALTGRRSVAELGGLHLGGRGRGQLRREGRVVDHGEVLGSRLRRDVAVVLALVVGAEDVGDDLL